MRDLAPLIAALEEEHCNECTSNACDIDAAYKADCYLWAAHILIGATECPKVEKAYVKIDPTAAELEDERLALLDTTRHVSCVNCEAVCWDVAREDICGNCGSSFYDHPAFAEAPDEEEEETVLRKLPAKDWVNVAGTQDPDKRYAPGVPTLRKNALNAQEAVEAYARETGNDAEADRAAVISDLLTDLMHFCDRTGGNFDELLQKADHNYEAEINGEA